ncbi:hypothetical protein [Aquella oligotrophica]|uniref:hypothetical protein n=1 Tax=Aquella oligotrophica TaxID=2067065 RepID=UPI001315939D|nr:hypothetical protein [Aquella oligotrophica]
MSVRSRMEPPIPEAAIHCTQNRLPICFCALSRSAVSRRVIRCRYEWGGSVKTSSIHIRKCLHRKVVQGWMTVSRQVDNREIWKLLATQEPLLADVA